MDYKIKTIGQLGDALRAVRKEAHLTQIQVAESVGLYPKTISLIESGSSGSTIDTLFRCVSALGYDITLVPRNRKSDPETEW